MKSRMAVGSAWTLAGYLLSQVLRLATNLILQRLLLPEVFGTMALVAVFQQGLAMFSDIGIGPSIIQHRSGDQRLFLRTAYSIQAVRGLALWISSALIAIPIALSGGADIASVLPIAGVTAFIAGFNSTALFTQQRRVALGRVTLLNLGSQVVASAVMILWACQSPTVWASVGSGIAAAVFVATMSHFMLGRGGHRDGFAWDPASARELVRFGRWIFISTVLAFFSSQGDKLIFAPLIPRDLLGIYNNASTLAGAPTAAIVMLANAVLFPALSTQMRERGSLAGVYDRARKPVLWLSAMLAAGLIASGPSFVHLLYAKAFVEADWMVRLLAVVGFLQILESTVGAALLAMGRSREIAIYCALKLVGMVVFIPIGYGLLGFEGAVLGLIAAEFLKYLGAVVAGVRVGLSIVGRDCSAIAIAVVSSAAGMAAGVGVESIGGPMWLRFVCEGGAVVAICGGAFLVWVPELRKRVLGVLW